jgi:WD40 repeat protein
LQGQRSAAEAEQNFAKAESQRLAGESSTLLQLQGSAEVAALLALRGLNADYSPQADMSLQRASRLDFGRDWLPSTGPVDALDVSPDGAHVITIARDGVARLWSVATGALEREYQVGVTFSWPILFSPDGTRFLISAEEGVSIWDLASGARIFSADPGSDADWSVDGSQVFIGRGDSVDVVDIASGSIVRTMKVPSESLQLFPGGDRLLTSAGGEAYISDARTGLVVHQMSGIGSTKHVAVSPDGRYVATGAQDKTAKVWDAQTGELVQTLVGHSEILFGIAFSPDGTKLLTGSLDDTARLWDLASGKEIRRLTGHTAAVYAVGFTPDGRYAITSSADKSARIWDLTSPLEADTLAGQSSFVYAVDFSPDGSRIFTGSADGTGLLWDATSHQIVSRLYTDSRVDTAAFSPDGRYLLLGHLDKKAELWDVATGTLVRVLQGSSGGATAGFSADGRLMLAGAGSTHGPAVGVWDVASGTFLRIFDAKGDGRAVLSPDGRYVAIGLDEATDNLRIFDATTGDLLRILTSGTGATSIAFAPDSRHVLTGNRDNIGRIIDVETGEARELIGHTNIMWGAAFSPDGRYALTGSQDRTARLWDVATGREVRRFASHQYSAIAGVAFSADGKTIGIGNFDGYTQLTPTDLPALVSSTCGRLRRDFGPSERLIYEIPDELPTCSATTSISTRAPLGSAATPTVERAGGGSPTNLP